MRLTVVSVYDPWFLERVRVMGVFTDGNEWRYVDDHPLTPGQRYMLTYCRLDEGLPGTGAGVTPENAPSREDDAAPEPEPAHICAEEDESC